MSLLPGPLVDRLLKPFVTCSQTFRALLVSYSFLSATGIRLPVTLEIGKRDSITYIIHTSLLFTLGFLE